MPQWEYCSVKLIWREERKNLEHFKARVVYYQPGGNRAVKDIQTDIAVDDYLAISAIGYALAELGLEGWELAHMQHSEGNIGFQLAIEAMCKRPISSAAE